MTVPAESTAFLPPSDKSAGEQPKPTMVNIFSPPEKIDLSRRETAEQKGERQIDGDGNARDGENAGKAQKIRGADPARGAGGQPDEIQPRARENFFIPYNI